MDINNIKRILVVGAGVMGHGIAQVFAQSGYDVRLMDLDRATLDKSLSMIHSSLKTLEKKGMLDADAGKHIMDRIQTFTELARAAEGADFVVEVVPEVAELKQKVFKQLDRVCAPETILATNTSGLDLATLADDCRPSHLVATHFFAPAQIIPLVEVAPGPETRSDVVEITEALLKKVGKQPVVMKSFVPSFIVNRIQNYIGMAVIEILSNNWATPEEIDLAVKSSLGIRLPIVGVVQTMDFTGLDCVNHISGGSIPMIADKVAAGHLGAKTSKGFYDYQERSETEIVEKRDLRYLEMIKVLREMNAFEPI